jgi:hypothetical protein
MKFSQIIKNVLPKLDLSKVSLRGKLVNAKQAMYEDQYDEDIEMGLMKTRNNLVWSGIYGEPFTIYTASEEVAIEDKANFISYELGTNYFKLNRRDISERVTRNWITKEYLKMIDFNSRGIFALDRRNAPQY